MTAFPTLTLEDSQCFDALLQDLITQSGATNTLIVEKAGYLLHECGERGTYDTTVIATLAANSFCAAEMMAEQLAETNFTTLSQQGDRLNTLILKMTDSALLVIIFRASISRTVMLNFARHPARQIANQIYRAMQRNPDNLVDFSDLNVTNAQEFFQK